jgi:hypothetical protein
MVSSSCFTTVSRRGTLVTIPVINPEWGKDREVFSTSGTYSWSFVLKQLDIRVCFHFSIISSHMFVMVNVRDISWEWHLHC